MARSRKHALLSVLLGLLATCHTANAMFEDQAGTYDWYQSYVGGVLGAAFHRSKPRVFVGTQQGVAASLNLRDGSVAFRHLVPTAGGAGEPAPTLSALLDSPALFVSLSGGSALHAWDPADGVQRWATSLGAGPTLIAALGIVAASPSPQIAALGSGKLHVLEPLSGAVVQSASLSEGAAASGAAILHAGTTLDSLVAFAWTPGQQSVYAVTLAGESEIASPEPLSSVAASGPSGFAALSVDRTQLCSAAAGATQLTCTSLDSLAAQAISGSPAVVLVATAQGWALASGDPGKPGAVLLTASPGGALTVAATYSSASAVSRPLVVGDHEAIAAVQVKTTGELVLQYVSVATGAVLATEGPVKGAQSDKLAPGAAPPAIKAAYLGTYKKRDQTDGFRALLVWSDERVTFVQQGVAVWSRAEALSGVHSVLVSELPPATTAASRAGLPDKWTDQLSLLLKLQLLSAKVQFKLATPDEVSELAGLREALSDKHLPTRDARGFRRSLIVATSSGVVAALHTGDGRVLWQRPPPPEAASSARLLEWRTYHDLTHAPRVAVLWGGADAANPSAQSVLSVLDVYTGAELSRTALPYTADKIIHVGRAAEDEHSEQQLYLAVDGNGAAATLPKVHLLPDTQAARSHFAKTHRSLYFFLDVPGAAPGGAAFRGFGFDAAAAAAVAAGGAATAAETWALALPHPVLAWAVRDPQEPLYTSVKVLGDRSMKYRYLNPNTLIVVTGPTGGGSADTHPGDTTILVVDSVTGAVRYQQTAPGATGPAVAHLRGNAAAVQLWDASSARFVVISLELYDASERQFSVLDHMFNPNASRPQSSFAPPPLEVLTASFFTRTPAKAMAATRTLAGITSQLLLLLTHTDQVYSLDVRFLDPRRPRHTKLTAEEQEERLLPYLDTLPLTPLSFTTLNHQVLGLRGLVSAPSRLESTSLLLSWGVDLQYTRLAPAKGFDSLDDDFSYGLLLLALGGLLGASVFLHSYTKASQLKSKWQ